MKSVLGLVSLLLVVAIVALVARQQMHAVAPAAAPAATAPSPRQVEQQVGADVQKALEAGQSRNDAAERRLEGDAR